MRYFYSCKTPKICQICVQEGKDGVIPAGKPYYGDSSKTFCEEHGLKVLRGELTYDKKQKIYTDSANCEICGKPSRNILFGRRVCDDCIGEVIGAAES